MPKPILLLVDDNEDLVNSLTRALRSDYDVRSAGTLAEAHRLLSTPPDIALLDIRLDDRDLHNRDGVALLQTLRQQFINLPVLMNTAYGDHDAAAECARLGAADFIDKSRSDIVEIRTRLARALEQERLRRHSFELEQKLNLIEPRDIVGASPKMQELKRSIEAVAADGRMTVLIRGESGTGKELVARAIHASGRRSSGPFVWVVPAALPPDLIESELFGHEPGAFTGAAKRHIGYVERARDGVLFFDEIGDLDGRLQVKMLRFLEEREFQRVGGGRPLSVDVQVIAATNADLWAGIEDGTFRKDLYFRLKSFDLVIPPLRERTEDIPLLVDHFLNLLRQQGRRILPFSPQAMDCLLRYHWPGNVRQLRNTVESTLLYAQIKKRTQVEAEDLDLPHGDFDAPEGGGDSEAPLAPLMLSGRITLDEALARTELALIERALLQVQGKKTEAWKLLGLNHRFALRRRVMKIAERYPHLTHEFPYVKSSYEDEAAEGVTARAGHKS